VEGWLEMNKLVFAGVIVAVLVGGFLVGLSIGNSMSCFYPKDIMRLSCAVYNNSMACFSNGTFICNPVDFSGSRMWIFKPPCDVNLTGILVCDYNLTSKVFTNCTMLNVTEDHLV